MKTMLESKMHILKKSIHAPDFLNEPIEYGNAFSRGIKVDAGNITFLFISGTASVDKHGNTYCPNDFSNQVKRTFDNLTALLKAEGTDWHDVVQTRCYLKDMKFYDEFNIYRTHFYKENNLDPFPSSVAVQATLCRPDLLVEIEATAILNNSKEK